MSTRVLPFETESLAVRRSRVNGRGVFAVACLPGRRKIGEISGDLVKLPAAWSRVAGLRKIYMVQVSPRYALDCTQGNLFKYLNHSCAPNCYLRVFRKRVEVYTLRDLEPETELCVDYGATPHKSGMICRCGADNCRSIL